MGQLTKVFEEWSLWHRAALTSATGMLSRWVAHATVDGACTMCCACNMCQARSRWVAHATLDCACTIWCARKSCLIWQPLLAHATRLRCFEGRLLCCAQHGACTVTGSSYYHSRNCTLKCEGEEKVVIKLLPVMLLSHMAKDHVAMIWRWAEVHDTGTMGTRMCPWLAG